jgi:hypothetical protein
MIFRKIMLKSLQRKYKKLSKLSNNANIQVKREKISLKMKNIIMNKNTIINVRRGIFETNSSSTHALVIMSYNYKEPNTGSNIQPGEFSWNSRVYKSTESKLSYLMTYAINMNDVEFFRILEETFPLYKLNAFIINSRLMNINDIDSYIDHVGCLLSTIHAFKESKELMKAFVYNHDNFLETGNDNGEGVYAENFPRALIVFEKGN